MLVLTFCYRYFPLLIKFKRSSPDLTPLPFIMSLLTSTKSHGSVVGTIMDMVDKILTWEESIADDEVPVPPLIINDLLPVDTYNIKGKKIDITRQYHLVFKFVLVLGFTMQIKNRLYINHPISFQNKLSIHKIKKNILINFTKI